MPLVPRRPLSAVANPYLYLDHLGRLAGACPFDWTLSAGQRKFIGAEHDDEKTKVIVPKEAGYFGDSRDHKTDLVWKFSALPQEIPDSDEHRKALKSGSVFPGDLKTHVKVGVPGEFVAYPDALAKARAAAIAQWAVDHEGDAPSCAGEGEAKVCAEMKPGKTPAETLATLTKALLPHAKAAVDAAIGLERDERPAEIAKAPKATGGDK